MRKNANTCAFAGTIDGNCSELLSITCSPDAETPRIEKLETRFRDHLKHLTKDFQTKHGYTRDEPGKANMTLACNSVGQKFDCLSLTLEMPFKDNNDAPNALTGWSGKRSKQLGKDVLTTVAEMVAVLR